MSKFKVEFRVGDSIKSEVVDSRSPDFRGAGGPADVRIARAFPRSYKKNNQRSGLIKVVRVTKVGYENR